MMTVLMIDEYDTQHLSITEASLLNRIFENLEQFKNSTIFIATHPIKISRTVYVKDESEEKNVRIQTYAERIEKFPFLQP